MMVRTTILAACSAALFAAAPADAATAITKSAGYGLGPSSARPAPEPRAVRPPVRLAQAGDALVRINRLEEELRALTGQVEELRFQLLQAQEDMRKRQEDNEFRFQQIEGGGSSGSGSNSQGGQQRGDLGNASGSAPDTAASNETGQSIDDIGQLLDGAAGASGGNGSGDEPASSGAESSGTVAAIEPEGAGEMYDLAYNYLLAGDYQLAEQAFRQYSQTYPKAPDAPDARYWLGESLYQQQKYTDAAEVFLDAQKDSPDNAKAPEMMLKLGMSLAKLNNSDVACTTFGEVARRYPQMSENVKSKLAAEEKAANC